MNTAVLRRFSAIALAVTFFTTAISGVIMYFSRPMASRLGLFPVHDTLGLVMVAAGFVHFFLNLKPICTYLKNFGMQILTAVLVVWLAYLCWYGVTHKRNHRPPQPGGPQQVQPMNGAQPGAAIPGEAAPAGAVAGQGGAAWHHGHGNGGPHGHPQQ